jgi:N-acetylneuraminic acid mutarotase
MRRILLILLFPFLLLASVGKITVSNGDVSIARAGKAIKGISNTPLEEKDTINTKAGSSAQIIFSDGTAISLGAGTTFNIKEYLFDEKANSVNLKVGVSEGAFKAITGKIGKISPEKFKLETKTATIGIRGTAFLGLIPKEGPETIACTKGSIAVAPLPVIVAPLATGQATPAPSPVGTPLPSGQQTAPVSGQAPATTTTPTPSAAPALAPPPSPVAIEVKAGEMTTVSVGKVEAPRAFTQAEIKKLEKASSTESKKADAPVAAPSEKKADSNDKGGGGGGDKTEAKTEQKQESKQEAKAEPKAESKVETKQDTQTVTSAQPITQTTVALSAPAAPIITLPTGTISNIASTVSNIQNTVANIQSTVVSVINSINSANDSNSIKTLIDNQTSTQVITQQIQTAQDIHQVNINNAIVSPTVTNISIVSDYLSDNTWGAIAQNAIVSILQNAVTTSNTNTQQSVFQALAQNQLITQAQVLPIFNQIQGDGNILTTYIQASKDYMKSVLEATTAFAPSSMSNVVQQRASNYVGGESSVVTLSNASILITDGVTQAIKYNPTANTWSQIALPSTERSMLASASLQDGSVLAIGGYGLSSVEKYDPTANSWSYVATMNETRWRLSAVALRDGSVLAIGGTGDSGVLSSVEKYDPTANSWSYVAPMNMARTYFSATTLKDGSVLAIGGDLSSVEKYDPTANSWSYVASMNMARYAHSSVLLQDGNVLVIGGSDKSSVEKYNPATNLWQYVVSLPFDFWNGAAATLPNGNVLLKNGGSSSVFEYDYKKGIDSGAYVVQNSMLNIGRSMHASALLQDGSVLTFGGQNSSGSDLSSVEKYNPSTSTWSYIASMDVSRRQLAATTLQDGSILAIGGANQSSVEKYDPIANSWSYIASMNAPRWNLAAATLQDGSVLAIGGYSFNDTKLSSVEKYDPVGDVWSYIASMNTTRPGLTAVTLMNGNVLAIGGQTSSVEKYDPTANNWSYVASMNMVRFGHSSVLLQDGSVLTIGGMVDYGNNLQSVEKYNPATNLWQYVVSLPFSLVNSSAITLQNGNVLLIGGQNESITTAGVFEYSKDAAQITVQSNIAHKASLSEVVYASSATSLNNGSILLIGGLTSTNSKLTTVQKYDYSLDTWTQVASMDTPRYLLAATPMKNGGALAIGGTGNSGDLSSVEKYDPTTNSWSYISSMNISRSGLAAVTLQDGSVLAIGGQGNNAQLSSVEKYDPTTNSWSYISSMNISRSGLAAVTLQDGSVLAIGGTSRLTDPNRPWWHDMTTTASVEKYNPTTGSWSYVASMNEPRETFNAVILKNGSVLVFDGGKTVEKYNSSLNTWQYTLSLPFNLGGYSSAAILPNGNVLLISPNTTDVYEYKTNFTSSPYWNNNPNINNGFFVGYENSNMSGNRVVGNLNSILFSTESAATGLSINANSGELSGNLSSVILPGNGHNVMTTTMDFAHFDGTQVTSKYNGEDDKVIMGQTTIIANGVTRVANIGFQTLPDKVDAVTGALSSVDDYSSWGYWEAIADASGSDPAIEYHGWWVSGIPTPAAVIQQLITNSASYNYTGHVLGDTFNNTNLDPIILNKNNMINMTVNFGVANPINVTKLQFDTSQGWSYNQSTNLSNTASNISVNTTANTQGYTATVGNNINTADSLNLQGKFYGPAANSTGGVFAGSLTGSASAANSQRVVQGVFKARR